MLVMEVTKRVLGGEQPDPLSSMANLASTYQHEGRRKEDEQPRACDEDHEASAWRGASRHAEVHGQPGVNSPELGPAEGCRGATGAGVED